MRSLLVVLALLLPLPSLAQQDVEDAKRTIAAIEGLLKQRPNDATLWFYMARFQSTAGDKKACVAALEKVLELGDGFLPPRNDFEKVWDDPGFQAVRAKLEAKLPRLDFAPTAFEIDDKKLIPEGIAYDAPSSSFFVGGVAGHKVLRVSETHGPSHFAGKESGLDEVLGIAADSPRRILYVVSTNALTTAGEKDRRNAVVAFNVDNGKVLQRYDAPTARQLNDVAVAPGGRVFASDSASGAIFELELKAGTMKTLVPPDRVRGSNGLAASPDGKRLYVAHSTGLAVVDLASGEIARVANETRENFAAIDGLYEFQGQLIGVQNVTTPGRVIVITLSNDGKSVIKVQTLVSHHHTALYEPTTGAVTPRGFYLLAATGVTHYNREGKIERPDDVPKPLVLRIPLPR